jgi:hypothetical protein
MTIEEMMVMDPAAKLALLETLRAPLLTQHEVSLADAKMGERALAFVLDLSNYLTAKAEHNGKTVAILDGIITKAKEGKYGSLP